MAGQDDIAVYGKRRTMDAVIVLIFLLFFARLFQLQMIYSAPIGSASPLRSGPRQKRTTMNTRLLIDGVAAASMKSPWAFKASA